MLDDGHDVNNGDGDHNDYYIIIKTMRIMIIMITIMMANDDDGDDDGDYNDDYNNN